MPVAIVSPFAMKGNKTRGDNGVERDGTLPQLLLKYLDFVHFKKNILHFYKYFVRASKGTHAKGLKTFFISFMVTVPLFLTLNFKIFIFKMGRRPLL